MHDVTCDEHGFVRGFPYHDGFLDGILLDRRRSQVHLVIRDLEGGERTLTLYDVAAFCANGVREGNIILNLRVIGPDAAPLDERERRSLLDTFGVSELSATQRVFLLESSYGADVIAICGDIEVRDGAFTG